MVLSQCGNKQVSTILLSIGKDQRWQILPKDAFIVYCNAAAVPMYRLLIYRRSTQCTAPQVKINLTLLQYRTAVVGVETAIRALQLTATQLWWTMNAA